MSNQNENLVGRLPLLDPKELAPAQAKLYKVMDNTVIAWANQSGFVVKTRDGKFIGPFNPSLYSPGITDGFSKFMDAEPKNTKLDKRTRQIVILTVGAVWNSPYEVYAHSAEARSRSENDPGCVKTWHEQRMRRIVSSRFFFRWLAELSFSNST